MTRHWWLFWFALFAGIAVMLLVLYGCGEFRVGLRAADAPTTRPYVEVRSGDTQYDRWLPYAMTAAALLAWLLPSCWPLKRRK